MFEKPSNLFSQAYETEKQVSFLNSSDTDVVDLFWIDYSGEEIFVATIPPNQQVGQNTFATHPFLMKSLLSRNIVGLFVIDEQLPQRSILKYGEKYHNIVVGNGERVNSSRVVQNVTYKKANIQKDQYSGLKSPSDSRPAELHVTNRTSLKLESFWVDFEGNLIPNGSVEAGRTFSSKSSQGHVFVFKTVDCFYQKVITASSDHPYQFLDPDEMEITSSVVDSPNESSCHSILEKYIEGRCGRKYLFFNEAHADQMFSEIVTKLKQEGKRFIDEDFLPQDNWQRANDFFNKGERIFKGEISPKTPVQGNVGDCWLIQSLSGAARLSNKIKDIFCKCEYVDSSLGLYVLSFYNTDGTRQCIFLDDFFHFNSTNLNTSKSNTFGEMWVPLIEKAFAKMVGSFEALNPSVGNHNLNPADVLLFLLGGRNGRSMEWYSGINSEGKKMMYEGKFYPLVEKLIDSKKSVPVCTSNANKKEGQVDEHGLVHYHGYSMLGYRKFPQYGINLFHIRNTWSKQEWNGDWSDNSVMWARYPDIGSELDYKISDDGCFWISYEDFVSNFCVLWWNEF